MLILNRLPLVPGEDSSRSTFHIGPDIHYLDRLPATMSSRNALVSTLLEILECSQL